MNDDGKHNTPQNHFVRAYEIKYPFLETLLWLMKDNEPNNRPTIKSADDPMGTK